MFLNEGQTCVICNALIAIRKDVSFRESMGEDCCLSDKVNILIVRGHLGSLKCCRQCSGSQLTMERFFLRYAEAIRVHTQHFVLGWIIHGMGSMPRIPHQLGEKAKRAVYKEPYPDGYGSLESFMCQKILHPAQFTVDDLGLTAVVCLKKGSPGSMLRTNPTGCLSEVRTLDVTKNMRAPRSKSIPRKRPNKYGHS
jgi:hypothetical protein